MVAEYGETPVGFHKQGWNKEQPGRYQHKTIKSQQKAIPDEFLRHGEWS